MVSPTQEMQRKCCDLDTVGCSVGTCEDSQTGALHICGHSDMEPLAAIPCETAHEAAAPARNSALPEANRFVGNTERLLLVFCRMTQVEQLAELERLEALYGG